MSKTSYTAFIAANKKDKFLRLADAFYKTYRSELVVIARNPSSGIKSMLDLLGRVSERQTKHVLIASHGWTNGLWLPIVSKGPKATTDRIATILILYWRRHDFRELLDDQKPELWFRDKEKTKNSLARLKRIFPAHAFSFGDESAALNAVKRTLGSGTGLGVSDAYGKIEANIHELQRSSNAKSQLEKEGANTQQAVKVWWSSALAAAGLRNDEDASAYFAVLKEVRKRRIAEVEIRGCRIGKSKASSQMLRIFLNAGKLRAPTVDLLTAQPTVKVEPGRVEARESHRWKTTSGWVEWNPGNVYYAPSLAEWSQWIEEKIGKPRKKIRKTMPMIFTESEPPTYIREIEPQLRSYK